MEGKAKEAFEKWFENNYLDNWMYYNRPENSTIINALKIEWLDSVGILIFLKRMVLGHRDFAFEDWYFIITNKRGIHLNDFLDKECRINIDDRNLATEAAIKKAVEIFNEKYKENE
ncbi:hypothetical protein CMU02_08960 [Elizabethkingia anophelis]|uniref:hypothetical protein n=1 Tax=Elizabethkingia anophelis TaxID=1117645 RepID=UPI00293C7136|nr:hypothetical protein [Elizabethkingia anophelis]MDV3904940.1 hypothetical protein [Elizabethkingia anophelis]